MIKAASSLERRSHSIRLGVTLVATATTRWSRLPYGALKVITKRPQNEGRLSHVATSFSSAFALEPCLRQRPSMEALHLCTYAQAHVHTYTYTHAHTCTFIRELL